MLSHFKTNEKYGVIISGTRLFNKSLNKRGPKVQPCGTPDDTKQEEENFPKMRIILISSFINVFDNR
jgi:hypothetical protein